MRRRHWAAQCIVSSVGEQVAANASSVSTGPRRTRAFSCTVAKNASLRGRIRPSRVCCCVRRGSGCSRKRHGRSRCGMVRSRPCSCFCYRGRALLRWGRFLPTQTVQWHSVLSIADCASRSFLQGSTLRRAAVASPSLWCQPRTRHPCSCLCGEMMMTVIRQTSLRVRILQTVHHLATSVPRRTVFPMILGTSNNI